MSMLKRLSIMAMAMAIGLAATAAHAWDDYRGRWWRTPEITRQMNLSESEVRQLDDAFETARIRMIELKGKVKIEQGKLRALMEQTDFNESAVRRQHGIEEAARSQLADARFEFLLQVRKILGHDRFLKLLDLRAERRQKRHHDRDDDRKD